MESYADLYYYTEIYKGAVLGSEEDTEKALLNSSIHVDTLTFNRIVERFEELTDFQQGVIKDVVCKLAEWEYNNADALNSALKSYSINGVSMSFDKAYNVRMVNGVTVPAAIYGELEQTGLCCGRLP